MYFFASPMYRTGVMHSEKDKNKLMRNERIARSMRITVSGFSRPRETRRRASPWSMSSGRKSGISVNATP